MTEPSFDTILINNELQAIIPPNIFPTSVQQFIHGSEHSFPNIQYNFYKENEAANIFKNDGIDFGFDTSNINNTIIQHHSDVSSTSNHSDYYTAKIDINSTIVIDKPILIDFVNKNQFTIAFWIDISSLSSDANIFAMENVALNYISENRFDLTILNTTISNTTFIPETWNFIAMTYKGSSSFELYVNNTVEKQIITTNLINTGDLTFLNADIKDIRVFSKTLSSEKIRYLYNVEQYNSKLIGDTNTTYLHHSSVNYKNGPITKEILLNNANDAFHNFTYCYWITFDDTSLYFDQQHIRLNILDGFYLQNRSDVDGYLYTEIYNSVDTLLHSIKSIHTFTHNKSYFIAVSCKYINNALNIVQYIDNSDPVSYIIPNTTYTYDIKHEIVFGTTAFILEDIRLYTITLSYYEIIDIWIQAGKKYLQILPIPEKWFGWVENISNPYGLREVLEYTYSNITEGTVGTIGDTIDIYVPVIESTNKLVYDYSANPYFKFPYFAEHENSIVAWYKFDKDVIPTTADFLTYGTFDNHEANLIAWYKFDNNSILDSSGNENNLEIATNTSFQNTYYKKGINSLKINLGTYSSSIGEGARTILNQPIDLNLVTTLSFSFWIYLHEIVLSTTSIRSDTILNFTDSSYTEHIFTIDSSTASQNWRLIIDHPKWGSASIISLDN